MSIYFLLGVVFPTYYIEFSCSIYHRIPFIFYLRLPSNLRSRSNGSFVLSTVVTNNRLKLYTVVVLGDASVSYRSDAFYMPTFDAHSADLGDTQDEHLR